MAKKKHTYASLKEGAGKTNKLDLKFLEGAENAGVPISILERLAERQGVPLEELKLVPLETLLAGLKPN